MLADAGDEPLRADAGGQGGGREAVLLGWHLVTALASPAVAVALVGTGSGSGQGRPPGTLTETGE